MVRRAECFGRLKPQYPRLASRLFNALPCWHCSWASASAQANTWLAVSGAGSQGAPISIYPSNASGNLAPSATIQGNAVSINGCNSLDHDPLADEVYCADFSGQALAIFAANASGNVAPLRRITSAQAIGQLRAATRLGTSEELAVLRSFGAGIRILPRGGNGEVQALRSISGSNTQLHNPLKIVFLYG